MCIAATGSSELPGRGYHVKLSLTPEPDVGFGTEAQSPTAA